MMLFQVVILRYIRPLTLLCLTLFTRQNSLLFSLISVLLVSYLPLLITTSFSLGGLLSLHKSVNKSSPALFPFWPTAIPSHFQKSFISEPFSPLTSRLTTCPATGSTHHHWAPCGQNLRPWRASFNTLPSPLFLLLLEGNTKSFVSSSGSIPFSSFSSSSGFSYLSSSSSSYAIILLCSLV